MIDPQEHPTEQEEALADAIGELENEHQALNRVKAMHGHTYAGPVAGSDELVKDLFMGTEINAEAAAVCADSMGRQIAGELLERKVAIDREALTALVAGAWLDGMAMGARHQVTLAGE